MSVQESALRLLARREHSELELKRKLIAREFPLHEIDDCLESLKRDNLLSNTRFAACFIRAQAALGKGPERIRHLLFSRGLSQETVISSLLEAEIDWHELARTVVQKKFGLVQPESLAEKVKREKFLFYRGFTEDLVRSAIDAAIES